MYESRRFVGWIRSIEHAIGRPGTTPFTIPKPVSTALRRLPWTELAGFDLAVAAAAYSALS